MATADLKAFIETRLDVLSPGIDLSNGSPAQTQFVQPLIDYLGTDPFSTDISTFLQDRLLQEFPDIYPGDPGVINDIFINPLIMFLEPFKREITAVQNGQSLANPSLLSDQDADAIGANWFSYRSTGGLATGTARVYFSNPTTVTFQVTARFFTSGGLNFFPSIPVGVTAEQMVFNRQGSLFYADVQLQSESAGEQYNIGVDEISGIDGVFGYIKVTNLQAFTNGSPSVSTTEFIGNIKQALNERSLVTRRGATARILDTFRSTVRSVQQVGATDPEMQRDILMAVGSGHAWMTGTVSIYSNVAFAQITTLDDSSTSPTVSPGDELYIYLDKHSYVNTWQALDQALRFVRFTIEEVIYGPLDTSATTDYQLAYLLRISGSAPAGIVLPNPVTVRGGLIKKSAIVVSSTDGAVDAEVVSGGVHVYGRSDIYVKPIVQNPTTTSFTALRDDPAKSLFKLQGTTLTTNGEDVSDKNKVVYSGNFETSGVQIGDSLVIESGPDAGSYRIIQVAADAAYLSQNLTKTASGVRFSVARSISMNPFGARRLKIPFAGSINNDLQTFIGSSTVRVSSPSSSFVEYGVVANDILSILTGPDVGDYTILGLSSDGREVYLDRNLTSSNGMITYEVYNSLGAIDLPLLRIKKVDLLDSSGQTIGITIPPAEPVAVMPVANFTSALVRGGSQGPTGVVLPRLKGGSGGNFAAPSGDQRYSQGYDPTNGGTYRSMHFTTGTYSEFLFPSDVETSLSYFLAVCEDDANSENFPPISPKSGDALTIKDGPNKGSYLIKSVYKFRHPNGGKLFWSYFVEIYGEFPVDVLGSVASFLDGAGISTTTLWPSNNPGVSLDYPAFFVNAYNSLAAKIDAAFTAVGIVSPGVDLIGSVLSQSAEVGYEWGDPARGTLRTFVQEPTLFQLNTADSATPTLFDHKSDSQTQTYRPDPTRYERHTIVPGKGAADQGPGAYPRDYSQTALDVSLTVGEGVNPLNAGVMVGDVISIYPEVPFHNTTQGTSRQTAVITTAGSPVITTPTSSGVSFTKDRVGDLLFIDEGKDKGAYVIQKFIDSKTLSLDRALTRTTPVILSEGSIASWGYDGSLDLVTAVGSDDYSALIGKYITLYGINVVYQGSYLITAAPIAGQVAVSRSGMDPNHFPAYAADTDGRWVITDAPVLPANTTSGTELVGIQPVRFYSDVVVEETIDTIVPDPQSRDLTVTTSRTSLYKEPYSIYRKNIRRVPSAEVATNRDGPFYYFDTDVVSLGPESSFNIPKDSYLSMRDGTYSSLGYRHRVADSTLTYSVREKGALDFSAKILPSTATDSEDNMIPLIGAPVQVIYERASVVADVQTFASSADDHVTSADILIRHFLPSYVSYEASYTGGSDASIVAQDIIQLIAALGIEATLDVSEVQKAIEDRGGNPETPTKLYVLVHDWKRKQLAEMSENSIKMSALEVPYSGTARVITFTPGPDVSGQTDLPYGEKINLTKF